jgi:hypothetical protein
VTVLNIVLNVILIRGLGPIPALGAVGAAIGTTTASGLVALYALYPLIHGGWVVDVPATRAAPRSTGDHPRAVPLRAAHGHPGDRDEPGRHAAARVHRLARAERGRAGRRTRSRTRELFSLITWTSTGLLGAAAAIAGQNLGAGNPQRAEARRAHGGPLRGRGAAALGLCSSSIRASCSAIFGMNDPAVRRDRRAAAARAQRVGALHHDSPLTYTGGLQGTGDTKSPLYISIVSQIVIPLGICFVIRQTSQLDPIDIWPRHPGRHVTRCVLSVVRFNQGKWRGIEVDIGATP